MVLNLVVTKSEEEGDFSKNFSFHKPNVSSANCISNGEYCQVIQVF